MSLERPRSITRTDRFEKFQGDRYGLERENNSASRPATGGDMLGVRSSLALRHWSRGWLTAWQGWDVMT